MTSVKILIKNTVSMSVVHGIQPIFNMVLVLIIGRVLGKIVFGKYTTIFFVLQIFQVISSFGLRIYLTREVAKHRDLAVKYFRNSALVSLPLSLVSIVAMCSLAILLNYEGDVKTGIFLISISLIPATLSECLEGILSGFQRLGKVAKTWMTFLTLRVILSVSLILAGFGLLTIIFIHVLTKFIQPIIYYYYLSKLIGAAKSKIDINFSKQLLKSTWMFAFIMIFVSLFWRIDVIMISKINGFQEAGIFGAAYKLVWVTMLMSKSFFVAFFPMISSMYKEKNLQFQKFCRNSLRYLFIISFPIALLISFYAKPLITLLWGQKYVDAIPLLQIMIWILIPYTISEVLAYSLVASDNQKIDLLVNMISLIVKFILCWFFIPQYGALGAVVSSISAMVILLLLQIPFIVKRLIKFSLYRFLQLSVKFVFSASIMSGLLILFRQYNMIMVGGSVFIIYLFSLFFFKIISEEDKIIFKNLLKRA